MKSNSNIENQYLLLEPIGFDEVAANEEVYEIIEMARTYLLAKCFNSCLSTRLIFFYWEQNGFVMNLTWLANFR